MDITEGEDDEGDVGDSEAYSEEELLDAEESLWVYDDVLEAGTGFHHLILFIT